MAPRIFSFSSMMGAALSETRYSVPSLLMSTVCVIRSTTLPVRRTFSTGSATDLRVCSLMIWNTIGSGRPRASATVQPVRPTAIGFMRVMLPSTSVTMTASPMLSRVMARPRSRSCNFCCASRRSVMSRKVTTAPTHLCSSNIGCDQYSAEKQLPSSRHNTSLSMCVPSCFLKAR